MFEINCNLTKHAPIVEHSNNSKKGRSRVRTGNEHIIGNNSALHHTSLEHASTNEQVALKSEGSTLSGISRTIRISSCCYVLT